MNVAHAIGENRLQHLHPGHFAEILRSAAVEPDSEQLVHSISNIIQGNTLLHPYHRDGKALKKFDYIVSNPPFKMDFSDFRNELETKETKERFFAGVPMTVSAGAFWIFGKPWSAAAFTKCTRAPPSCRSRTGMSSPTALWTLRPTWPHRRAFPNSRRHTPNRLSKAPLRATGEISVFR
jgi:hypothetical protein